MPKGGQRISLAERLSTSWNAARDAWFGPGVPLQPMAPDEVRGRQFDFPTAFNLVARPRAEQSDYGITFDQLRALADPTRGGLDLVRLAIEKRKDQMEGQRWSIRARSGDDDGGPRARKLEQQLRSPDGVQTYSQWMRAILDDLLTIDAPCVYLCPQADGSRVPEVMDGGTLKRLISEDGRVPRPPEAAFQQILKGIPAVSYTLDEVIYLPRNVRSDRVYGMSPVEQIALTVNIALRRQLSQLEAYTAGSVPDMTISCPPTWSAAQIKEAQSHFDALLSGDTAERRRVRFLPGGSVPHLLKQGALKDEFDEWLARIVCWAFNLSPQALTKQMNRATAETAKQAAQEEGLEPLKLWWKDFFDQVLARCFNAPDLELTFEDEEITDPVDKANVLSIGLGRGGGAKWLTVDEVRAMYGLDPATPEQMEELKPAPPPALPAPGAPDDEPGEPTNPPAHKVLKSARRSLRPR